MSLRRDLQTLPPGAESHSAYRWFARWRHTKSRRRRGADVSSAIALQRYGGAELRVGPGHWRKNREVAEIRRRTRENNAIDRHAGIARSEEHTSELQSPKDL